ncbi:hypothetical protein [Streptomyces sp. AK02-04a]|uniref:hypothetical protein n=1 Tax=Streptomyces sp. AK02-04a TaxID=3028649 RepID=UPI0029A3DEED|nr:hypothetical protein [Streptomyces sp. AK02-04a]MDX3762407.1 hypothetical protein [Streptomyces sp. AK02-04a]
MAASGVHELGGGGEPAGTVVSKDTGAVLLSFDNAAPFGPLLLDAQRAEPNLVDVYTAHRMRHAFRVLLADEQRDDGPAPAPLSSAPTRSRLTGLAVGASALDLDSLEAFAANLWRDQNFWPDVIELLVVTTRPKGGFYVLNSEARLNRAQEIARIDDDYALRTAHRQSVAQIQQAVATAADPQRQGENRHPPAHRRPQRDGDAESYQLAVRLLVGARAAGQRAWAVRRGRAGWKRANTSAQAH